MLTVRGRPGRAVLVLAVIVALLLLVLRPGRVTSYDMHVVARLGWGGQGLHVLDTSAEGRRFGPRSFAVGGDGTVFVADTFGGGRVLAVLPDGSVKPMQPEDAQGAPIQTDDVVVAPGSQPRVLYLADNRTHTVWRWTPGQSASAYYEPGASGSNWVVQGLAISPSGQPVVDAVHVSDKEYAREIRRLAAEDNDTVVLARQTVTVKGTRQEGIEPPDGKGRPERIGLGPQGRLFALSAGGSDFDAVVHVFGADGRAQRSIRLQTKAPLDQTQILGLDDSGALYLGIDLGAPDGRVLKVDSKGHAIWTVRLPVPAGAPLLGVYARVDAGGNLYVLSPGASGVELRTYRLHQHWTLRPI